MEDGALLKTILSRHWSEISPLEVKLFLTLFWLADPASGQLSISLKRLSDSLDVSLDALTLHLEQLLARGLILFEGSKDDLLDSHFKILVITNTQDMHNKDGFFASTGEESNRPSAYVNDNVNGNNKNRSLNVNVTCAKKKSPIGTHDGRAELTAKHIAQVLGDEKNIALYEAYVKRYPRDVIAKAYDQVLKTPHHRIKKSLGAYFTFLVRKYGGSAG